MLCRAERRVPRSRANEPCNEHPDVGAEPQSHHSAYPGSDVIPVAAVRTQRWQLLEHDAGWRRVDCRCGGPVARHRHRGPQLPPPLRFIRGRGADGYALACADDCAFECTDHCAFECTDHCAHGPANYDLPTNPLLLLPGLCGVGLSCVRLAE